MFDISKAKLLYLNRVYSPSRIKMLYRCDMLGEKTNIYTLTDDQLLELGFKIRNQVWLFPRWFARIHIQGLYTHVDGTQIDTATLAVETKTLYDDFNLNYGISNAKRILPISSQVRPKETRDRTKIPKLEVGWVSRVMGWWRN